MTDAALVRLLVQRVLHWNLASDRYLLPNRSWIPLWKFRPLERVTDACRLLDAARPSRYVIQFDRGRFQVEVVIQGRAGRASGVSMPRAIASALAGSLRLEVPA